MREVILDTETTGFDWRKGDRIIEIGCVELINRIPTGREYQAYVNPQREVPQAAFAVHGISTDFLRDKPLFGDVAQSCLDFIGGDPLVIHNAAFDVPFLNFELEKSGRRPLGVDRVVDTLELARRKHPAGPNSLDALCKRYNVDLSKRTKHGALLDCQLLAEIYIELLGERQATFGLGAGETAAAMRSARSGARRLARVRTEHLAPRISATETATHRAYIEALGAKAVWLKHWLRQSGE